MSSTYGRKQKAAAMAACRWGNLEKVTVEDFQCQVGNGNVKDAETQTEINFALSLPTMQASKKTLSPLPFRSLRNWLTAFAIKLYEPVNLCP